MTLRVSGVNWVENLLTQVYLDLEVGVLDE